MKNKSFVRACGFLLVAAFTLFTVRTAQGALAVKLLNQNLNYTDDQVFITFGGAGAGSIDGTINGQAIVPGKSYSINSLNSGSGIQLEYFAAGKIMISVGNPIRTANVGNAYSPAFTNPSLEDYRTRWDKIEITYLGTRSTASSLANLSSVDFYGIPLEVKTTKNGAAASRISWNISGSAAFTVLGALCQQNPTAFILGSQGIDSNKPIRSVNPGSAVPPIPYPSFANYISSTQNSGLVTQVVGLYTANAGNQTFNMAAKILQTSAVYGPVTANPGDVVISGTVQNVNGTATVIIPSANFAANLYGANFAYTVVTPSGARSGVSGDNDVYSAAVRDYSGGFNLGLIGTSAIDPRTNVPFSSEDTSVWYSLGSHETLLKLTANQVFGAIQSNPSYFNGYASFISRNSDSYGFAFSDLLANPFVNLAPSAADTMIITVLSDGR